jgi:hypothetical protein
MTDEEWTTYYQTNVHIPFAWSRIQRVAPIVRLASHYPRLIMAVTPFWEMIDMAIDLKGMFESTPEEAIFWRTIGDTDDDLPNPAAVFTTMVGDNIAAATDQSPGVAIANEVEVFTPVPPPETPLDSSLDIEDIDW